MKYDEYIEHGTGRSSASPNLANQVCLYMIEDARHDGERKYIFGYYDADDAERLGKNLIAAAKRSRTKAHAKELATA